MKLKLSVSSIKLEGKLGSHTPRVVWRKFNGSFENVQIMPSLLPGIVRGGYSITTWHSGYRKRDNFLLGQHLATDHDNGGITFDQIVANQFVSENAFLVHTTASHTEESHRLRVIYVLDQEITNPKFYVECAQSIQARFTDSADPSTHDPCRLFFGNRNAKIKVLGNIMPLRKMGEIALDWRERNVARDSCQQVESDLSEVGDSYMTLIVGRSLNKLQYSSPGMRHTNALTISRTLGGYVASGLLDAEMIEAKLIDAALIAGLPQLEAERVVHDGIAYGMESPIVPVTTKPGYTENPWEVFGL